MPFVVRRAFRFSKGTAVLPSERGGMAPRGYLVLALFMVLAAVAAGCGGGGGAEQATETPTVAPEPTATPLPPAEPIPTSTLAPG